MRIFITIIFTFLFSLGYAQRKGNERGYWKAVPVDNVEMITPATIEKRLRGTEWSCYGSDEWFVKNGVLMRYKFILYPGYDVVYVDPPEMPIEIDEDVIEYPWASGDVLYFGRNNVTRYKYDTLIQEPFMEKSIIPYSDNVILFLDPKEIRLYLCTSEYRTDGKLFKVDRFHLWSCEAIEWAEIHYCIMTTHFTILDRVEYPPVKITDIICNAPQNPNVRVELPYQKIKRYKRNH